MADTKVPTLLDLMGGAAQRLSIVMTQLPEVEGDEADELEAQSIVLARFVQQSGRLALPALRRSRPRPTAAQETSEATRPAPVAPEVEETPTEPALPSPVELAGQAAADMQASARKRRAS